jgi:hypothetical protein
MKGKYEILVKDMHLQYKFTITRNITILRGDSATGKTTLIDMIAAYQQNRERSGVTLRSDKKCVVLNEMNWQLNLSQIKDSIVFIDEGGAFVKTTEFAELIKKSDNYYVIATRVSLADLPYSVQEVYGIKNTSGNRYQGTKRLYSKFVPLYISEHVKDVANPDLVIVEDSNAGYQFFKHICEQQSVECISAGGKSSIYNEVSKCNAQNILVIADGAAFGAEMEGILSLRRIKNISLFLPESFEWIILKSNLVHDVSEVMENPELYIESSRFFSWEQFFTAYLIEKSKDTYLAYRKQRLNPVYLQKREVSMIMNNIPILK